MDRRAFLEASVVLAGGVLLGQARTSEAAAEPPMIAIQAGAVSFLDEGT